VSRTHYHGIEIASQREYERDGRGYRDIVLINGNKVHEPIETLGDHLRLAAQLATMLGAFVVLTSGWIWAAHAVFAAKASYAVIIPTHVIAAFLIAVVTILVGGFSESKLAALGVIIIACPLVTVLVAAFSALAA
jgi:hypothetical protein